GTHIDIAQSRDLELRVELRREFDPLRIRIDLTAVALQCAQKESDSAIDVRVSGRVGGVPELVRPALVVELQSRTSGDAEIAGGEIRKQRLFAGPTIAMALVASRFAAKQLVAQFFLRRELVFSGLHVVVLRREGAHLWRELVSGNGQSEFVVHMIGASSVCRIQMNRVRVILRWWSW